MSNPPTGASTPQTSRRTTTTVWGIFVCVLVALVGGLAASSQHGWALAAWIVITLAIIEVVAITLLWPCVIIRDEDSTIRNSFIEYEVPYAAIEKVDATRMGVIARTKSGKKIPIAAYTSGSSGRRLRHSQAADSLLDAIELRRSRIPATEEPPAHTMRMQYPNLIVTVAIIVAAVVVTWIAATR